MKVNLLDQFNELPYDSGEICGVKGMTFHGNPIAHGVYSVVV